MCVCVCKLIVCWSLVFSSPSRVCVRCTLMCSCVRVRARERAPQAARHVLVCWWPCVCVCVHVCVCVCVCVSLCRWMDYPCTGYDVRHPHDASVMTYRGHTVHHTLIRAYFSPAATTGQRLIYSEWCMGSLSRTHTHTHAHPRTHTHACTSTLTHTRMHIHAHTHTHA